MSVGAAYIRKGVSMLSRRNELIEARFTSHISLLNRDTLIKKLILYIFSELDHP